MKILIIGSEGQLGSELRKKYPSDVSVSAVDYPEFDICNEESVNSCIKELTPDWVINAAAYTAVDLAETETEKAMQVNSTGVKYLAKVVKESGGKLVQISTDFVFDGIKGSPYLTTDIPSPVSEYGRTKLEGEKAVLEIFGDDALIIRTAWLYSATGNNFVKTMLRLMDEKESLNVVDDQIGTPCWAFGLANAVWSAVGKNASGVFHWTDFGVASWYDFAVAIQEEAFALGLLKKKIPVNPISSKNYPTPAKRPAYSVLDKTSALETFDVEPVHWRVQLRKMFAEIKKD